MPVRINCPHCHQELRLPDELYAGRAQCPFCEGAFAVRWRRHSGRTTMPQGDESERRLRCRFCGEPILPDAVKCPACAESLEM
jgi:Zn finger protein HypA/HybF involved in hydrogenase expression